MNETWTEDISNPTIYGSFIFGNGLFGSVEWIDETTTTVTWSEQTTDSTTWTEA